jgi:uncharacterized protein (DUF1800 family)
MADAATRADVALLLRRAGFAATGAEVDAAADAGYAATVDAVMAALAPGADAAADAIAVPDLSVAAAPGKDAPVAQRQAYNQQLRQQAAALVQWWVDRMIVAQRPAAEKLAWFWHGHFATSLDKVKVAALMYRQNQIFRQDGAGDFTSLTGAVAQDPAMLRWLDADTNVAAHPNENFARELMELFTLGIGNYSETDVKEAARTFTGWSFDRATLAFAERPRLHDRGTKTILGQSGAFDGLDTIRHITGTDASARFVAARVWSRYARPVDPADPIVTDLAAAWGPSRGVDLLLRSVFTHPQFATDATRTGLVKQPVEWAVGAVRAFGLAPTAPLAGKVTVGTATTHVLAALGQTPFRPPSVGGWPAQAAWLNTAADQLKLSFAQALAAPALATPAGQALVAATDRPAQLAWLLGLDGWRPATAAALGQVARDPATLVTFALTSPDFSLA